MIRMVFKTLKIINSETDPGQISLALCFAMVAGLTPFFGLHNLPILLLVLILRVNLSAFLLGLAIFSGMAYAVDPLSHRIGLAALTADPLQGIWTSLYNSSFWLLTRFNNSILMGSLVLSLVLFIPLYLLSNLLIRKYRAHILAWIQASRIMQIWSASRFYSLYQSYQSTVGWWR